MLLVNAPGGFNKSSSYRSIEHISENGDADRQQVENTREKEQPIIILLVATLELAHPALVPAVHKVNDEHQLHDNEQKAANDAAHHEHLLEGAARYVEGADEQANVNEYLKEPQTCWNIE